MDSIKALFTAVGSVTGGRNGHGEAEDHSVSVNLSCPRPWRSRSTQHEPHPNICSRSATPPASVAHSIFVAVPEEEERQGRNRHCSVSIGPRDAGGFGIAVKLHVNDATLPQAELEALPARAHEKICPYSHATRNNVPVELSVEGG